MSWIITVVLLIETDKGHDLFSNVQLYGALGSQYDCSACLHKARDTKYFDIGLITTGILASPTSGHGIFLKVTLFSNGKLKLSVILEMYKIHQLYQAFRCI